MAPQVKALVSRCDDGSLIPAAQVVEEGNKSLSVGF